MSVTTRYDEMRNDLKDMLKGCLKHTHGMMADDIWGYDEFEDGYIEEIYMAIKKVINMI